MRWCCNVHQMWSPGPFACRRAWLTVHLVKCSERWVVKCTIRRHFQNLEIWIWRSVESLILFQETSLMTVSWMRVDYYFCAYCWHRDTEIILRPKSPFRKANSTSNRLYWYCYYQYIISRYYAHGKSITSQVLELLRLQLNASSQ